MKMQMRIVDFTEESDGEDESGSGVVGGESERSGGLWFPSQLCSEIGSKISQWASVTPSPTSSSSASCSGKHRGLGIHISFVRSAHIIFLCNLTSNLPGSAFVLGHVHWLGYDAIMHPSRYGLGDVGDPCCTTWANGTSGCIPELQPCTPTDNHYFWDAFHLTEAVYSVIAARCINDTSVCMPTSIKALVQI
ncbi:hypothetical protein RHSIM_Rhsim08G0078200 [Rhododendron simsii]|uniref:GDSL esterase/lipase n=1 Tax=Rhododendron simsii TaxID=118357 RepID=A0A834GI21_RHOSS|nr:hypothetical protein RHSIM_Rhsim08G0078200 [Rhododendron simsii]